MSEALPVLLALLLLAPTAATQPPAHESAAPDELEHGTFETHTFHSEALDRDLEYGVYLPEGYRDPANEDRRYPLAVWLHGMFEDDRRFDERGGTAVLDRLIGEGKVPEMVFVTAEGGSRSFYLNGVESGRWEDAITKDLLQQIDREYRVRKDRAGRVLMGVSMGGYGALRIALQHPDLFGVVAAHSAAILPRDPDRLDEQFPWLQRWGGGQKALASLFGDPIDRDMWRAENLLEIAADVDPSDLDGLRIYFDVGDEDRYGFDGPNRELHELLEKRHIPHEFRVVEGGNHGWRTGYNQAALPHSLAFVAAALSAHQGTSALRGLLQGGMPAGDGKGR